MNYRRPKRYAHKVELPSGRTFKWRRGVWHLVRP